MRRKRWIEGKKCQRTFDDRFRAHRKLHHIRDIVHVERQELGRVQRLVVVALPVVQLPLIRADAQMQERTIRVKECRIFLEYIDTRLENFVDVFSIQMS